MPTLPRISGSGGPRKLWGGRDADGHRTWHAVYRVRVAEDKDDSAPVVGVNVPPYLYGPAAALQCPGLPIEGSQWFPLAGEVDVWAWCRSNNDVTPVGKEGGPIKFYDVSFTYSTKPPSLDRGGRQQPESQRPRKEDPLAEQDKISGSFIKYSEEAWVDRFGVPIVSTSFEPFRGAQVEFDANRPQIRLEQNVLDLQLALLYRMVNTVNDRPLWGFPRRCIKLGVPNWEWKFHGNGLIYFTRSLEFDINCYADPITGEMRSGFDRELLDEGSKALNGHYDFDTGAWTLDDINGADPDPGNPAHYSRYQDRFGNTARCIFTKDSTKRGQPMDDVIGGGITAATNATPIVVSTTNDHGLAAGDYVAIAGVKGNTAANGAFFVSVVGGATQFTIINKDGLTNTVGNGDFDANSYARWFKLNSNANKISIEKYDESNFLLLGIPVGRL